MATAEAGQEQFDQQRARLAAVVVDRLSPNERVALVLHESFGFDFDTIGDILERGPAAARKLASRARAKTAGAEPGGRITDQRIEGREAIAAFFNGSAHAALPVFIGGRPGFAWFQRGTPAVVFDFNVESDGRRRRT
ncbi:hypothetical protein B7R21_07810 [Subtercola boreus]|uniref:RNA polymerase sigma factor 70 region 4 type 2 domain-containing protein n=1 Tax=Subtercola boreus TaxID=120213 RepID=A0A3E0VVK5_9MICO|nr:hypothetical protein [Subtercola boreus]RFA13730.1 hypothetical protein B7R21_07810 [Subtercola boreus]